MNRSGNGLFATTRWTLVRAVNGEGSADALESLCAVYWLPLYAYVRASGFTREDAEDLVQGFFVSLLDGRGFDALRRENGRFRAFLLAAMKHFLANEKDRLGRWKRGGRALHFSLDWQKADEQLGVADEKQISPDEMYDRKWALALLERVMGRLEGEYEKAGKAKGFGVLKNFLTVQRDEIPYAKAAEAMGMEVGSVRVAVHRLRKRYRDLLKEEVAQTLTEPEMVEEELRVLLRAFE